MCVCGYVCIYIYSYVYTDIQIFTQTHTYVYIYHIASRLSGPIGRRYVVGTYP